MEQNQIAAFAQENMKTIFAYALSRTSSREDAEDLAGDILLALLSSASRLRDEKALYGFVWSVAGNTYKKFLRRKKRQAPELLSQETMEQLADPEDFTLELAQNEERQELLVKLRRELSLLSWEYRECTLCYYFEGLSCQETAKKLGLTLDMTKYYLYKTRKLLKEGIGMEREYGTKSYQPAHFTFKTLFSGQYNPEYTRMFDRLLPGNILLSAYYSPVTIRELALETGVPTAYLEDEVALLLRYGLLHKLGTKDETEDTATGNEQTLSGRDRYRTNLVIFTEEYMDELYEKLTPLCTRSLTDILDALLSQLTPLRAVGFCGAELEDDRLLWPLFWLILHRGHRLFDSSGRYTYQPIYASATGINVGYNYSEKEGHYSTYGFAGYSRIDEKLAAAFADFGILPQKNRYLRQDLQAIRDAVRAGSKEYVLFEQAQLAEVEGLLKPQFRAVADLYEQMISLASDLLLSHAPESVAELVPNVIGMTLFFDTVGLLGKCAFGSGALRLPDTEYPLAVFLYRTNS